MIIPFINDGCTERDGLPGGRGWGRAHCWGHWQWVWATGGPGPNGAHPICRMSCFPALTYESSLKGQGNVSQWKMIRLWAAAGGPRRGEREPESSRWAGATLSHSTNANFYTKGYKTKQNSKCKHFRAFHITIFLSFWKHLLRPEL